MRNIWRLSGAGSGKHDIRISGKDTETMILVLRILMLIVAGAAIYFPPLAVIAVVIGVHYVHALVRQDMDVILQQTNDIREALERTEKASK